MYSCSRAVFAYSFTGLRIRFAAAHQEPKGIGSSLLESMPMGNAMASKQLMSTYAEILKSRSVIVPVIEQTEEADSDGNICVMKIISKTG